MTEDTKGPLWFAVENQYGHLSAVFDNRTMSAAALGLRGDADKCKLVHVRVIKVGDVPDQTKGKK